MSYLLQVKALKKHVRAAKTTHAQLDRKFRVAAKAAAKIEQVVNHELKQRDYLGVQWEKAEEAVEALSAAKSRLKEAKRISRQYKTQFAKMDRHCRKLMAKHTRLANKRNELAAARDKAAANWSESYEALQQLLAAKPAAKRGRPRKH
jgi:DNA repair ATPase RecN